MSKIAQVRELISRHNLDSMIQSGMPGYRVTIYEKSGRTLFCGNTSESLAYLRGYADAWVYAESDLFFQDNN